jgi:hypothetical protein
VSEGQVSFANENSKIKKQLMEQANNKRHATMMVSTGTGVCFEFQ